MNQFTVEENVTHRLLVFFRPNRVGPACEGDHRRHDEAIEAGLDKAGIIKAAWRLVAGAQWTSQDTVQRDYIIDEIYHYTISTKIVDRLKP